MIAFALSATAPAVGRAPAAVWAAHAAEPGQTAEPWLVPSSTPACASFVLQHGSPQGQVFLPGCGIHFPLEFLELQVVPYLLTLLFCSSTFSEFGSLGVDALF